MPETAQVLIAALLRGEGFPHPVQSPRLVETHISWVILTGDWAYKIKKPVALGFLDFSTLEQRRHFCEEELRLNRRFAPDLYRDVVPIGGSAEQPQVGAEPALEWAVRMRQFPADAEMRAQLAAGQVTPADMRALAEVMAAAHAGAPVDETQESAAHDRALGPALDNFAALEDQRQDPATQARIAALREWTRVGAQSMADVFAARLAGGHVRDCHGDLHTGNIVRLDGALVAFDCIEFDPRLRRIDVINDIAFLVMDLLQTGRDDLAYEFLNRYLEVTDDYAGLALLPWYLVYRAMVRAKVAAIARDQHVRAAAAADDYLQLAGRLAKRPAAPLLVLCHGLSGSGKTWLSTRLLPLLPAIRLRSDLVRKRLQGLPELARTGSAVNQGLYTPDLSRRTYERLRESARIGLRAGFNMLVDATFLERRARLNFLRLASDLGARFVVLHCKAPEALLRERIVRRQHESRDASEATLDVLESQLRRLELATGEERAVVIDVDMAGDVDVAGLAASIRDRAIAAAPDA